MFLKEVWYAACWSDEIIQTKPLARKIADQPMVFWRKEDDTPCAIIDRCPHRYAPLSMGQVVKDGIQCGYHGLVFSGDGSCCYNPHGRISTSLSVRSYPVIDRYRIAWVWLGDVEDADPALIPDLSFANRAPDTAYSRGYMLVAAGHQLISDNILDLTHADYLHSSTLGGGSVSRAKPFVEIREDNAVFVEWLANEEVALPFFKKEMPEEDMLTDMWTSVLWHPNGVMRLRFGATPTGRPREEGIDTWNAHIATPETARTTHYFYFNTREFRVNDSDYNRHFAEGLRYAFSNEDKPMIEAQQRLLGDSDLFDHKPALLSNDAASTRARRVYDKLLKAESSEKD